MKILFRSAFALLLLLSIGAPASADDAGDIQAAQRFAAPFFAGQCRFTDNADGDFADANHVFPLRYRLPGQDQDEADHALILIQLFCSADAHNFSSVYLTKNPVNGEFKILSFAEPRLDYDYTDENFTVLKRPPALLGYQTRFALFNSAYDPATGSISMRLKWRDKGDAWSSGVWTWTDGEFLLKRYDVDPTYDRDAAEGKKADPGQTPFYQIYPSPL